MCCAAITLQVAVLYALIEIALAVIVLDVEHSRFAVLVVDQVEHAVVCPASMKTTHVICRLVGNYVEEKINNSIKKTITDSMPNMLIHVVSMTVVVLTAAVVIKYVMRVILLNALNALYFDNYHSKITF